MSLFFLTRSGAIRIVLAALVAGAAVPLVAVPASAAQRISGADRIETSARVATASFPSGTSTAVLARADNYPDALAAAGLAGALSAPVVLTHSSGLAPTTREVLKELGVTDVVLLGGKSALTDQVAREVQALGAEVRRIGGTNRYATAAAIARAVPEIGEVGGQKTAFVAGGQNFPDALSAGGPAYAGRLPLLLSRHMSLPDESSGALTDLGIERVVLLGGTGAVSEVVEGELRALGLRVDRISGSSRYGTAAELATFAAEHMGSSTGEVVVVNGDDFPDALSAGPFAGERKAPILLSGRMSVSAATAAWLAGNCERTTDLRVLGGPGAVSDSAVEEAEAAAQCARDVTPPVPPPVPAEWPGEDTTGVPAGTSLTASDSLIVRDDGAVIDGLDVSGMITVYADNVTIRRTRVRTDGERYGINISTDARGTVIEDVTVIGTDDSCGVGIVHAHYTVRRSDISGCVDGLRIGNNTTVEDSYVHDLRWFPGAHTDAVQSLGGTRIRIVGNRLEGRWRDSTAAIIMGTHNGRLDDILIESNLLSGGTYTVYLGEKNEGDAAPSNVRFTNNVWVAESWKYGTHSTSATADITWSGNITSDGKSVP